MADKGLEVKAIRKSRVIGRIFVTGYDFSLPRKHVMRVLKKLFSSCGKITDVYLPMSNSDIKSIWGVAIIYFVGEGAVDKALRLNGTDMGGWTVCAEDYPFLPDDGCFAGFAVEGYDTSLSVSDIKCQFGKLFSSCGKIVEANIYKSSCSSMVFVEGEDRRDGPKTYWDRNWRAQSSCSACYSIARQNPLSTPAASEAAWAVALSVIAPQLANHHLPSLPKKERDREREEKGAWIWIQTVTRDREKREHVRCFHRF